MVGDASFWAKLDAVLLLLRPINTSLAEFWSDGNFVPAVFNQFRQLSRTNAYHDELDNSEHQLRFLQDGELDDAIADATTMISADPEGKQKVSDEITQFVTDKLAWREDKKQRYQSCTPLNWWPTRQTKSCGH
ncbi:hypothetical protein F444_02024 [Phytophthora nicotianae P1976]|uniref:Uncharacterized protein n=1 Tax=Phytophthora nicotianae P1976 TaxID=1317066 RepID=A0A081AYT1_PHYNI|nr:hypothetical protein F444_02024 [Phytophthora nicotianae P1976]